jgi:aminoglycoside 3-N-acetyltransferase
MMSSIADQLAGQLRELGLRPGDAVMVHTAFRALGIRDPEAIIQALLAVVGDEGILLMPALSYLQQPPNLHDSDNTRTCVGFLAEYYRLRPGSVRSLHPTHSVCASGPQTAAWLNDHALDNTPAGPHSPFSLLPLRGGKILMLGCGLKPNTMMHAVEEHIRPSYLLGSPMIYTITDHNRRTFQKEYTPHSFRGMLQRYDRVRALLEPGAIREGKVGRADAFLIRSDELFPLALQRLQEDPLAFVESET